MRLRSFVLFVVSPAFMSIMASPAVAGSNLVFDGNFEYAATTVEGDLRTLFSTDQLLNDSSWFVSQGIVGIDSTDSYVFDGRGSLCLSIGTGLDAITQRIQTVANQQYTISFWANADAQNQISVLFDGLVVPGAPTSINMGAPAWPGTWTQYTATGYTNSSSTALTFEGITEVPGQPGTFSIELDDISVVAAPEPATFPIFALFAILLGRRFLALASFGSAGASPSRPSDRPGCRRPGNI